MLLHDQDPKGRRPEDAEEDESANDTTPLNDDGSPILDEEDLKRMTCRTKKPKMLNGREKKDEVIIFRKQAYKKQTPRAYTRGFYMVAFSTASSTGVFSFFSPIMTPMPAS
ncbi:hypothetical protein MKQ70_13940 [Chitinophaga sedimenti]|uniref:hypothetical protein n=1 Tax=Chitinophaga sedimenti TaxID=2033606 RepID=UPI00200658AB|nr:hypothetical protein [Chitinophaga sedimenti]MCK7556060.1 hypothetical protein [Chitinophaga sedimenti]